MTSSQDPSLNLIVTDDEDFLNILLPQNTIAETQSHMIYGDKNVSSSEVLPFGNKYNVNFDKNSSDLDKYLSNWTASDKQLGGLSYQQPLTESQQIDCMTEEYLSNWTTSVQQQGRSSDQQPLTEIQQKYHVWTLSDQQLQGRSPDQQPLTESQQKDHFWTPSDKQQGRSPDQQPLTESQQKDNFWTPSDKQQGRSPDQQPLTESQRIDCMTETEKIDYLAELMLDEPCQTTPILQQKIIQGTNSSEIDSSNATISCNLENGHVQNPMQYSELKPLSKPIIQNAWNITNVNPNLNTGIIDYFAGLITKDQTQPLHQNDKIMTNNTFDGVNTSQKPNLEYNHLQNRMQFSGDMKCIISQGVNTKGHVAVCPENTQNTFYDNVEKVKTETSCMKKRKKYEEDPHEDEEEERRRLQAKKAKNYRDKKKNELKMKDDQIKHIQEELQQSEREKMAYFVENKQLKEEIKKKNVLLQLYEGN